MRTQIPVCPIHGAPPYATSVFGPVRRSWVITHMTCMQPTAFTHMSRREVKEWADQYLREIDLALVRGGVYSVGEVPQ